MVLDSSDMHVWPIMLLVNDEHSMLAHTELAITFWSSSRVNDVEVLFLWSDSRGLTNIFWSKRPPVSDFWLIESAWNIRGSKTSFCLFWEWQFWIDVILHSAELII